MAVSGDDRVGESCAAKLLGLECETLAKRRSEGKAPPGLLGAKRIALLRELAPNTHALGLLVNPNNPNAEPETADIEAAAQSMHAQVQVLPASNGEEVEAAFAVLASSKLDGLVVNPDPIFFARRDQILALAAREAVPTIYYSGEYAEAGGLIAGSVADQSTDLHVFSPRIDCRQCMA
jgi:ABC-type uncharacterized transport system substrate-binding protein